VPENLVSWATRRARRERADLGGGSGLARVRGKNAVCGGSLNARYAQQRQELVRARPKTACRSGHFGNRQSCTKHQASVRVVFA